MSRVCSCAPARCHAAAERAARQHADEMAPVVRRGMQVGFAARSPARTASITSSPTIAGRGACRRATPRLRAAHCGVGRRRSSRCAPARSRRRTRVSVAATAASAKSPLRRATSSKPQPVLRRQLRHVISVTISSSARSTVSASRKKSRAATVRRARRRDDAQARHRAAAPSSAARRPDRHATGCRRWCRGCGSPDARRASSRRASTGKCRAITGEVSS